MQKIAAIINFCSNEYSFLKPCIEHLEPICEQIIVSVCDHFFDGKKEDLVFLKKVFSSFPTINFVQYPYLASCFSQKTFKKKGDRIFDSVSRTVGTTILDASIDYVLFIDADEIVDTLRFKTWLKKFPLKNYTALKLSNYWYFREEKYQAKNYEDSLLLVQKKALSKKVLFGPDDRDGIFRRCKGKKLQNTLGVDNKPLFHHYSWVRTKKQMLRKVLSWGHRKERDWKSLVEEEFSRPFNGKDFVHGYEFVTVEPYIQINLNAAPDKPKKILNNLIKISKSKALKSLSFPLWLRVLLLRS